MSSVGLFIAGAYLSALSVIIGGIANMVFTKTSLYRRFRSPIDGGASLGDGRRVFGDNKTWIGFASMMLFTALAQVLVGLSIRSFGWDDSAWVYRTHQNSLTFNAVLGLALGGAYMLFELPNSFTKRRVGIESGGHSGGARGVFFFILDQIDSLLGVFLAIALLSFVTCAEYWGGVILGGLTHIAVNALLRLVRVRENL